MKRFLRGRRGLAGFSLALAALPLAVGVAYATIPDSQGVIHACLKNGEPRIVDTETESCKENETALSWNQQGPQGIPGETGPPGPPGTDASVAGFADTGTVETSVQDEVWGRFHLVLEEPVPAGSYVVTASVTGRVQGQFSLPPNTTGGGVSRPRFDCILSRDPSGSSDPFFRVTTPLEDGGTVTVSGQPASFFREASVALTGAYTAASPTTLLVHCQLGFSSRTTNFAGSLTLTGSMTVVKVGSLG